MASTRTVEQTRIEGKTSSNKSNQKTSASKSTLPSWNTAASTGDTSFLKLVRESLPGLLGVHNRVDAVVSATKGSGTAVRQLPSFCRRPDHKESGVLTLICIHPAQIDTMPSEALSSAVSPGPPLRFVICLLIASQLGWVSLACW